MAETIRPLGELLDLMPVGNTTGEIGAQDLRDQTISDRSLAPQDSVISRGVNTPPGGPTLGDRYIVGASPTGDWAGQANNIAEWSDNVALGTNGWLFFPVKEGMHAWNNAADVLEVYDGTAWAALSVQGVLTLNGGDRIAVDTTTTSGTFVNLLTETLVLAETSVVFLVFTASISNSSGATQIMRFELRRNGALVDACGTRTQLANGPRPVALVYREKLSAGSYTFDINWKTSGGTAQVRPISDPDDEHARMEIIAFKAA